MFYDLLKRPIMTFIIYRAFARGVRRLEIAVPLMDRETDSVPS